MVVKIRQGDLEHAPWWRLSLLPLKLELELEFVLEAELELKFEQQLQLRLQLTTRANIIQLTSCQPRLRILVHWPTILLAGVVYRLSQRCQRYRTSLLHGKSSTRERQSWTRVERERESA